MMKHVFRAKIIDRMGADDKKTVAITRWYDTFSEAEEKGHNRRKKMFGSKNERYIVVVE